MIVNIPQYDGPGVYKITHTITGRIYIGSSLNCNARLKRHSKNPQNLKMEHDAAKGVFVAEIVKAFPEGCTNRELAEAEKYYCDFFEASTDKGYNDPNHSYFMHNERRGNTDDFVIPLFLPKGMKAKIRAHADARGESTNSFINRAIDEAMERDKAKDESGEP